MGSDDREADVAQNDADNDNTLSMGTVTSWRPPNTLTPLTTTCTISMPRMSIATLRAVLAVKLMQPICVAYYYNMHQFIDKDEARDAMDSDDNEANVSRNDLRWSPNTRIPLATACGSLPPWVGLVILLAVLTVWPMQPRMMLTNPATCRVPVHC